MWERVLKRQWRMAGGKGALGGSRKGKGYGSVFKNMVPHRNLRVFKNMVPHRFCQA